MPSLGFGIERLGLPALRRPGIALAVLAALSLLAGLGILRLKPGGALSELFRSHSVWFANYEKLNQLFPTNEYDVSVLIRGKHLLTPKTLDDIRNIQLELDFADNVEGIVSMFAMREQKMDKDGYAPPLFPADIPTGKKFDELLVKLRQHPQIMGKFFSPGKNGEDDVAMLLVTLEPGSTISGKLKKVIASLRASIDENIKGTGLSYMLTGSPIMQLEVRNSIRHDRITFNVIGFTLGVLISFYFLRQPLLVFMASICPAIAVLWLMGLLGHIGQPVNTFINVLPPLLMVITLSDAMHMVFAINKGLQSGQSRHDAIKKAILEVGPACVLTSLTTTIALLSMMLTDSADIRAFGLAGAAGVMMAFGVVITLVPALAMLLIGDEKKFIERSRQGHDPLAWLDGLCASLAALVSSHWRALSIGGVVLALLFSFFHSQLSVKYRLSDQIPDDMGAVQAMQLIDRRLSGSQKISIIVKWPQKLKLSDPKVIEAIGEAHRLLQSRPQIANVSSVESIRLYLKKPTGSVSSQKVAQYISKLPANMKERYVNMTGHAALVAGQVHNLEAASIKPVIDSLLPSIATLREEYPGFEFTPAGLSVLAAMQSTSMISQLNRSLLLAIVIVIVLMGTAFRSLQAGAISILPNLFPIVTVGTFLYFSGEGLQFASVMGLTVAFGLAVDDTIHFLNRYELEQRNGDEKENHNQRQMQFKQVANTLAHIGPVLILTTLILLCGLSVTSLSSLPVTRLFGQLSMATLAAALAADLLILPALLLLAGKFGLIGKRLAIAMNKKPS